MDAVIIRPGNQKQFLALKAFANALNLEFETKSENELFLQELKESVEEIKLIKAGKLRGRPAEKLISEL